MDIELTKRFTEVKEILKYLPEEYYIKIPKEIIQFIDEHQCKDYTWNIDTSKKIYEQNLDKNTIAILSFINMEYLVNPEQKEYLKKLYKTNDELNNANIVSIKEDIFHKNKSATADSEILIKYKDRNIFKKILIKVKKFLKI